MFSIEVAVNASLMKGAIGGGTKAVIALAGVIAFVNIGASFMFGRIILPNLFHKLPTKVWLGRFGTLLYIPLIVYINFALGVFRSLSEGQSQQFTSEKLQNVTQKTLKLALNPSPICRKMGQNGHLKLPKRVFLTPIGREYKIGFIFF